MAGKTQEVGGKKLKAWLQRSPPRPAKPSREKKEEKNKIRQAAKVDSGKKQRQLRKKKKEGADHGLKKSDKTVTRKEKPTENAGKKLKDGRLTVQKNTRFEKNYWQETVTRAEHKERTKKLVKLHKKKKTQPGQCKNNQTRRLPAKLRCTREVQKEVCSGLRGVQERAPKSTRSANRSRANPQTQNSRQARSTQKSPNEKKMKKK